MSWLRIIVSSIVILFIGFLAPTSAETSDREKAKEALKGIQEFIGDWKANGGPVRGSQGLWSEKISWGWRFKGDDSWLHVEFKDGKLYKSGDLRYLPEKKKFEFTLTTADGKKQVFEGEKKDSTMTFLYTDPETKRVTQMVMNTAADGIRLIYRINQKRSPRATIYRKLFLVQATREGEVLGAREKKNECVVTGGLGTQAIAYKGKTYYVCCSGCRDAFNEDPEKYIKEFEARKKKKK